MSGRWLLLGLLWGGLAWGQTFPEFQATQAVTDAGVTVLFDIDSNGTAENYEEVCLHNDGPQAVNYDFDGTATFSSTARAALLAGEALCFDRKLYTRKFTTVGLDVDTGGAASVRIRAMR